MESLEDYLAVESHSEVEELLLKLERLLTTQNLRTSEKCFCMAPVHLKCILAALAFCAEVLPEDLYICGVETIDLRGETTRGVKNSVEKNGKKDMTKR